MIYIGISSNKGHVVPKEQALQHVMHECGLKQERHTSLTPEVEEMLVDWYFSGNWILEDEDHAAGF